jgi:hypothetical protein
MGRLVLAVPACVLVLVCSACGAGETGGVDSPPAASVPAPAPVYEADLTVLEQHGKSSFPKHGPMLCLGAMALSYPPQCGDVPIANWDWDAVEGEETTSDASWGQYHVVGTYDGETFTVTEVGLYVNDPPKFGSEVDFSSPCPEPAGGWVLPDPKQALQQDARGANAYAQRQPDLVTSWVTHFPSNPDDTGLDEFDPVIFNAVFTDDVERHEAEIRKRWPGPLCVVEGEGPTKRELSRIRTQAEGYVAGELRLRMLGSSCCGVEPVIEIEVIADPEGAGQAALDARWPGLVRLFPVLRSVVAPR